MKYDRTLSLYAKEISWKVFAVVIAGILVQTLMAMRLMKSNSYITFEGIINEAYIPVTFFIEAAVVLITVLQSYGKLGRSYGYRMMGISDKEDTGSKIIYNLMISVLLVTSEIVFIGILCRVFMSYLPEKYLSDTILFMAVRNNLFLYQLFPVGDFGFMITEIAGIISFCIFAAFCSKGKLKKKDKVIMVICVFVVIVAMVFSLFEIIIRALYSYSLAGYEYLGMQPLFYIASVVVILTARSRNCRNEADAL